MFLKPIVIAGNGPSLKEIDYRRLPKEYDVFRCNHFFLEDKYYLGKNSVGFFSGIPIYKHLFATTTVLEDRKEYFFEDYYFSGLIIDGLEDFLRPQLKEFFTMKIASDIYLQQKRMASFVNRNMITYGKYPTTGIVMILTAVALGYTEIYVTGIDFFKTKDGNMYTYTVDQKSTYAQTAYIPDSMESTWWHSEETEHMAIELVKTFESIKIYCLSENTELSKLLPLAPVQNNDPYIPEEKPEGYLKDIVLSFSQQREQEQEQREQEQREQEQEQREQEQREQEQEQRAKSKEQREQERLLQEEYERNQGIKQKIKNIFIKKDLVGEWDFIRQYWFVRLIYQTIKLPYIILKIIVKLIK